MDTHPGDTSRQVWTLTHGALYGEVSGPEEGIPILFLPGLRHDRTMWRNQSAEMSKRWRCVLVDLPGQGGAPAYEGALTVERLAEDVAELIARLGGTAHLVGFSMGGMIALRLAADLHRRADGNAKLASLSLLGASADAEPRYLRVAFGALLAVTQAVGWKRIECIAARLFYSGEFRKDPVHRAWIRRMIVESGPLHDVTVARAVVTRASCTDEDLRSITCPTLVLRGDRDRVRHRWESARISRLVPGAGGACVTLIGAGHGVCAERPKAVTEALTRFIGSV